MNGFITENNKIDYRNCTKIIELGKRPIDTIDDYVNWVHDWKDLHRELVEAIQTFRAAKDQAKADGNQLLCNTVWWRKIQLRSYARMMYELRTDRKQALHNQQFKQLENAA